MSHKPSLEQITIALQSGLPLQGILDDHPHVNKAAREKAGQFFRVSKTVAEGTDGFVFFSDPEGLTIKFTQSKIEAEFMNWVSQQRSGIPLIPPVELVGTLGKFQGVRNGALNKFWNRVMHDMLNLFSSPMMKAEMAERAKARSPNDINVAWKQMDTLVGEIRKARTKFDDYNTPTKREEIIESDEVQRPETEFFFIIRPDCPDLSGFKESPVLINAMNVLEDVLFKRAVPSELDSALLDLARLAPTFGRGAALQIRWFYRWALDNDLVVQSIAKPSNLGVYFSPLKSAVTGLPVPPRLVIRDWGEVRMKTGDFRSLVKEVDTPSAEMRERWKRFWNINSSLP